MSDKPAGSGEPPRWAAVYEAMTGATAPGKSHHHEDKVGADADSLRAGHEPDKFDAKGILMVPELVIAVVTATYVIITLTFNYFEPGVPTGDKSASKQATADAKRSYNERAAGISSTDEKAAVKQPRLEFVREVAVKDGESVAYRSMQNAERGNSPEITPQFLRPENYVDWTTNERKLVDPKWLDQGKGIARIPIADAIHILAHDKPLPAKKDGVPSAGTLNKPKLSNGGVAVDAPKIEAKKADDHKH